MSYPLNDGVLQIFDVDHGQCALLTVPGKERRHRVLIDCGHATNFHGHPWYPGRHLANENIQYIDLLICTNFDEDHASGFPSLLDINLKIGCILGNPTVPPEAIVALKTEDGMGPGIEALANDLATRRKAGWVESVPQIPGLGISYAWNPFPAFSDENNLSLVTFLHFRGFTFMFPGDLEKRGCMNLLSTWAPFKNLVRQVDVLIAPHHGRANGKCEEMFEVYECRPSLVVISDDYRQYASQETTDYYASKARGIPWFRSEGRRFVLTTRQDGEIAFLFSGGACTVC